MASIRYAVWAFRVSAFGGLVITQYFWIGILIVNFSLLVLGADLYFEPELRAYRRTTVLLVGCGIAGIWIWVAASVAPLGVQVLDLGVKGPDEQMWKMSPYYDVQLSINNSTDDEYTSLMVVITTNSQIGNIIKLGKCLEGSMEPATLLIPQLVNRKTGVIDNSVSLPPSLANRWTIRCDKIRERDSMDFNIGLVTVDQKGQVRDPKRPEWIEVEVTYKSFGRRPRHKMFHRVPLV